MREFNIITKNVTDFMKNIFPILENMIKQREPINIKTKQQIIEGLNTPIDDCILEDKIQ